jgi:glucose-1-phosphate thymidylyltransferase
VDLKGVIPLATPLTRVDLASPYAAHPALLRVANQPLVFHVLEQLRRAGVSEAALLVPTSILAEVKATVELEGLPEIALTYLPYELEAVEQGLRAATEFVGESSCLVHLADGLLSQELAPLIERIESAHPDLLVLVHRRAESEDSIGLAARRLLRLTDAAAASRAVELSGVCLFGPGVMARAARRGEGQRWWSGAELDLVALAESLVAEGGRLCVETVRGWQGYHGGAAELLELNRLALDLLALEEQITVADSGTRIEGPVAIHPSACIQSSVIIGPAVLGAGALVVDSYIGPYTSIGADVHIEGAEVERSIILPGASIRHVGGRLVASLVGRDARIFRDFSLPRAMRMNVGDGGEVALC